MSAKEKRTMEIAGIIASLDDIVISSHTGPDGDAVGSVCALLLALKKTGKRVVAFLEALPNRYKEIDGSELIAFDIPSGFEFNAFIALDCADKARLGKFEKYFDGAEVKINIDHHASNDSFGSINFVDENASSASEMVYDILKAHVGFAIDKSIASALYAGIAYDTGGFRHPCASRNTYDAAARLIDYGADFSAIYKRLFWTKRFEEIRILSTAFSKMSREFDGGLVWTSITAEELELANARSSDLDSIVEYCKSVEGSKVGAFIYQKKENEYKISLRSEPGYDISVIAAKFGGGGHKNAAGATYHGTLTECTEKLFKEVAAVIADIVIK